MSPLWVLPLLVSTAGAVAMAVTARRLVAEASALRPALDDLRRLGDEARIAADELESIHHRGADVADVRARARAARRAVQGGGRDSIAGSDPRRGAGDR